VSLDLWTEQSSKWGGKRSKKNRSQRHKEIGGTLEKKRHLGVGVIAAVQKGESWWEGTGEEKSRVNVGEAGELYVPGKWERKKKMDQSPTWHGKDGRPSLEGETSDTGY